MKNAAGWLHSGVPVRKNNLIFEYCPPFAAAIILHQKK